MQIGPYEIIPIVTSHFALDGGAMFGVVPKPLWSRATRVDELNRIDMVTRTLLLRSHDRLILVDTGNGNKWEEKLRQIYRIDVESYQLTHSLTQHGITPAEITDVICTHLHFDHVGGNTVFRGGKLEPAFPNATYWVQQANWDLANHPSEKDRASFLSENWSVLAENGLVKILAGEQEWIDGIRLEIVHGHTRGQQLPVISDGSTTLLYGGDLFPMRAHIPLPWVMAYDIAPMESIAEKKRILPRMVEEEWILFFEHDPDVHACRVLRTERGYQGGETVDIV